LVLKTHLDDGRINPNTQSSKGLNGIFYAISSDNARCMKFLLKGKKVKVNEALCAPGYRSLDIICTNGQVAMLKAILKYPGLQLNTLLPGINGSIVSIRYRRRAVQALVAKWYQRLPSKQEVPCSIRGEGSSF
jgi:ankyrin repeat protein